MVNSEEILYTDGQDIVVTISSLQVKDRFYSLKSIRRFSLAVLGPARVPGLIVFVIGVALVIAGDTQAIPSSLIGDFWIDDKFVNINIVAKWFGFAMIGLGAVAILLLRERYAVRIATDDGEKYAVVSRRKEYINEIVEALRRVQMMAEVQAGITDGRYI